MCHFAKKGSIYNVLSQPRTVDALPKEAVMVLSKSLLPIWCGLLSVLLCFGCSSSDSTKSLDESSAKEMVQRKLSREKANIPIYRIFGECIPTTRTDFSTLASSDRLFVCRKLMEAGFLDKHPQTRYYPLVAGTFAAKTPNGTDEFDLHIAPNSKSSCCALMIVGTYTSIGRWGRNPLSDVTGRVDPTGKVELDIHPASGLIIFPSSQTGTYIENGDKAYLKMNANGLEEYVGKATKQKFELQWYTYAWNPAFYSTFSSEQENAEVPIGQYQVEEVSDLKLVSDTEASCAYTFTVRPNRFGAVVWSLVPTRLRTRSGEAEFAKRPDGKWFLDNLDSQ